MKRFKVLFASLSAASIIVASFAFTTEVNRKAPSKIWYYTDGAPNQRIEGGFTTGPVIARTMIQATFTNTGNWNDLGNSATAYTSGDGSSFLNSFNITSYEVTSDNDNDGDISLSEALTAIWNVYNTTGVYPTSVFVDADGNGTGVTVNNITRAENTH